ncbi:MFS transporter [Lutibaculum baratangense]|uniref:Major facilitator superfamily (MFS) transporter n=1 Tax=Lutibaculum baratangense AMV1 TaxID=631454 RepID=V4RKN4_9HYPH|nr:MFS transporter [Lutibaculum baratangense]ESR23820.1 Major facilitator superfamily (MFS) transporter [Lutibaculum baratangense AMV1]
MTAAGLSTGGRGFGAGTRGRVISALGVGQILAWGSSYYLPAVLGHPMAAATGWSYAWVTGGLSLGLLVSGLAAIHVGRAIDTHGGRPVLVGSSLLMGAGLLLLAAAPSLPVYIAAWLVLGLAMGSGLYDAAFSTLGRLYGRDARSAISSLTLWGGFASTVCWPLSAFLVETVGWRGTCLVYAAIHLCLVLPLHFFVVPREARRERETLRAAETPADETRIGSTRRLVLFVLVAAILTSGSMIAGMWSVHIITILQANGLALAAAVGLGALVGPSQVGARIVERLFGTRHHPIWTLSAAAILVGGGLVLLLLGPPLPAAALIAYGAGNGIWSIARGTLPLAVFGASGYAALMGRLVTPSLIAQALSPSIGAVLMQAHGVSAALYVLVGLGAFNIVGVVALWILLWRAMRQGGAEVG